MEPLFILAFDHRTSLQRELFGSQNEISHQQTRALIGAKRLIYEGFQRSLDEGVEKSSAALLIDERFGSDVARRAKDEGIMFVLAVERSGQKVFQFEYGEDFASHIEAFDPTFCKALLRYNPEGDRAGNEIQAERLLELSQWSQRHRPRLMVELLVPPEAEQLASVGGDARRFDREQRPALMRWAIEELHGAGVRADVWKIEGLDKQEDCAAVAALIQAGEEEAGCVVLGRGADDATVEEWLRQAARVPGYIGFAVGRTIWWPAVDGYLNRDWPRERATEEISRRYRHFIDVYTSAG